MSLNFTEDLLHQFCYDLKLGKYESEYDKANKCLLVMEEVISIGNWQNPRELIETVKTIEAMIQSKIPWETTPCNMVERVIKIILDECYSCKNPDGKGCVQGLSQLIFADSVISAAECSDGMYLSDELEGCNISFSELKGRILDVLSEQYAELHECEEVIASQGESKIHSDEVIMTCSYCPYVTAFLKRAAIKRNFQVIVAESAPKYDGHITANALSSAGIQVMLIQDCAIFCMMSRVNKVIIGCQTVLRNGGIKAVVGTTALAIAAKLHSVPLYVCSPTYKFSLLSCEEVNHYLTPSGILPPEILKNNINVTVSQFDYVPPENISSFITNK